MKISSFDRRLRTVASPLLVLCAVGLASEVHAQCAATVPPPSPGVPVIMNTLNGLITTCAGPYVLNLSPGVYNELVVIPPNTEVSINGALPFGSSTIDGTGLSGPVITLSGGHTNTSVLQNFSITNGTAFQGGGIFAGPDSRPILRNLSISGCTAQFGGGIFVDSSMTGATPIQILRMSRLLVRGNHADVRGGGICVAGTGSAFGSPNPPDDIQIKLSDLSSNRAEQAGSGGAVGGALALNGGAVVHVDHTTLISNRADVEGGAIQAGNFGRLRVTECVLQSNLVTGSGAFGDYGGGALSTDFADLVSVLDSQFLSNTVTILGAFPVAHGGHVLIRNGAKFLPTTYVFQNDLFVGGKATNGGAMAILDDAPTDVLLSTFSQNSATAGGAIFSLAASTNLAPRVVDTAAFFDLASVPDVTGSLEIFSPSVLPNVSFSNIQHPGAPATYPGTGTQNGNPGWLTGYTCSYAPNAGFFLPQTALNPCFDKGNPLSSYPEISLGFSTSTVGAPDTGRVDIGYHHLPTTCP